MNELELKPIQREHLCRNNFIAQSTPTGCFPFEQKYSLAWSGRVKDNLNGLNWRDSQVFNCITFAKELCRAAFFPAIVQTIFWII